MSEWVNYTIEEVGTVVGGGTPSTNVKEFWGEDVAWITPKDLSNYKYKRISRGERSLSNLGLEKSSAQLLPKDSVLITSRAPIGYVAIAGNQVCTNQGFKSIIPFSGFNSDFIYYLIKTNVDALEAVSSGSTFKEISGSSLKRLNFKIPPLAEQKAIAHILGKLDDKIELNRKMNQTLEAMAQALFKSWFVDFDPVIDNALAAGHPIPKTLQAKAAQRQKLVSTQSGTTGAAGDHGSPSATAPRLIDTNPALAALFPNAFTYNESLGKWIPEGWEVKTIDEAATVVGGGTPSTKESAYYTTNGIPWLSPKDLSGYNWKYISKGATDITELGLQKSSATLMPKGSVLFSSRAPIGYIAIAENEVTTNQGFKSLIPNMGVPTEYLFQFLKANSDQIESVATGSTFKEVSGSALKGLLILIPTAALLEQHSVVIAPSNERSLVIQKETETLTQIRDTLLPQLISGKVRVPEGVIAQYAP